MDAEALHVVQVISGVMPLHGGPSFSVPGLNLALRQAGVNSKVFSDVASAGAECDESDSIVTFPRQWTGLPFLGKLHLSGALSSSLHDGKRHLDLIHSHGLWRMPNVYAGRAARRRGIPIVVSPRGMLSEVALGFSRRSKALFWTLCQRTAFDETRCFHATSSSESDEIRSFGVRKPIAVIPNGVELPEASPRGGSALAYRDRQEKTLLYLGRVHPQKGIDVLLAAWGSVAQEFPDWRLRIVGPGDATYLRQIRDLMRHLKAPRISVEGAVSGTAKWRTLGDADLFVLPSHKESFGLTVAESLGCGSPVIVTKGAPWAAVETHACGWWIDSGEAALAAALRTALSTPGDVLDAMGARGADWIRRDFAWEGIGREMAHVYRWLCGTGSRPESVRVE